MQNLLDNEVDNFFLQDELAPHTKADFAQHYVQNMYRVNDYSFTEPQKKQIVRHLNNLFVIDRENPMTIKLYHDSCMSHADYTAHSAQELLDLMLSNYAEFED